MRRFVEPAIVLRRTNYGERDRVITLLCKTSGKLAVFAKGVRSEKSRLAAGIELLSISEATLIENKRGMCTLAGARLVRHYGNITKDYERTQLAFEFLKQVNNYADDGAGQEYFDLLHVLFASLEDESLDIQLIELWSNLRLLQLSGSLSEFSTADRSHGAYNYDHDNNCFVGHPDGQFSVNDIKLLRLVSTQQKPIKLSEATGSEASLARFSRALLKTHLS